MNFTKEDAAKLSRAFPLDDNGHVCAFCGKTRRPQDALCRACWKRLTDAEQREYIGLGLIARADWIVDRIPRHRDRS